VSAGRRVVGVDGGNGRSGGRKKGGRRGRGNLCGSGGGRRGPRLGVCKSRGKVFNRRGVITGPVDLYSKGECLIVRGEDPGEENRGVVFLP